MAQLSLERLDEKMEKQGYVRVRSGMAKLHDVAVTQTTDRILAPILSTPESVDVFNREFGDDWMLYRLVSQPTTSSMNGASA